MGSQTVGRSNRLGQTNCLSNNEKFRRMPDLKGREHRAVNSGVPKQADRQGDRGWCSTVINIFTFI